jgi:hypothetical protein
MTDRKPAGMYQLQTSAGNLEDCRRTPASQSKRRPEAETYAEYANQSCMASRQRLKLIVRGLRERILHPATSSKSVVRSSIREIGAQVGFAASRKLFRLAERIERKAGAIRAKSS